MRYPGYYVIIALALAFIVLVIFPNLTIYHHKVIYKNFRIYSDKEIDDNIYIILDEVEKKLGALSGGEKARLIFAKIGIRKPNVLVLDEPTNHLDLEGIAWLEEKRGERGRHGQELVLSLWLADVLAADPSRTLADIVASVPFVSEDQNAAEWRR